MHPLIIALFIASYFGVLLLISRITSRKSDNQSYFIGNRKSHWYLVALGLIGDSLSGVTFISVPGTVVYAKFSYMQVVLGYFAGYMVINHILLPVYYRLKLTSIYSFLNNRFGSNAQKTGSFFFLTSRLLGAAGRLFLAVNTIQIFLFDQLNIPFFITVVVMIILMYIYTHKGGIKTLVWTDSFQSLLLLTGLILSITAILNQLNWDISFALQSVSESNYSEIFFWDWKEKSYFWKQFIGGAFIAIAMTGLDQNMMQKNLSCPSLRDAQKNIYTFSFVMLFVNLLFLSLGALLFIYSTKFGIELPSFNEKIQTDAVFPTLALNNLGSLAGLAFIIGLTAASFSSADSVLTTLTTSFCIDFLDFENKLKKDETKKVKIRNKVHIAFSLLLIIIIMLFKQLNNRAIIDTILIIANYTYGPLIGLFAFGLFTRFSIKDKWIPIICLISPLISYLLDAYSKDLLWGYKFGLELLLINGIITFLGLYLLRVFQLKQAQIEIR